MNRKTPLRPGDVAERSVNVLSSEDLYYGYPDGPVAWKPDRFEKNLSVYPVYRWRRYVSTVPLYLIFLKGTFRPNPRAASHPEFWHNPHVVDSEIDRIPDSTDYTSEIESERGFVTNLARAMIQDVREVGGRTDHDVNVVLCGERTASTCYCFPGGDACGS